MALRTEQHVGGPRAKDKSLLVAGFALLAQWLESPKGSDLLFEEKKKQQHSKQTLFQRMYPRIILRWPSHSKRLILPVMGLTFL